MQGIEHLSLGAVSTGVILLAGLFFYDIFWVFCTPVMVSVVRHLLLTAHVIAKMIFVPAVQCMSSSTV